MRQWKNKNGQNLQKDQDINEEKDITNPKVAVWNGRPLTRSVSLRVEGRRQIRDKASTL